MNQTVSEANRLRLAGQHEESLAVLQAYADQHGADPEIDFAIACVQDYLGQTRQAIAAYRRAMALGLPRKDLRSAYLGLGSSLRAVGDYVDALAVFDEGLGQFPKARELHVFRAMALYNLGRTKEAMRVCLHHLAQTTRDAELASLKQAITGYARNLDRSWP